MYNEEKTTTKIIKRVVKVRLPIKREIIVVDDGSTDNTPKKLEEIKKRFKKIKIIRHKKNKGKGSAIRTALKYTKGNIIGIQDADLEYNPSEYKKLLKPILNKKVKVVYGSRFKKGKNKKNLFYYGNRFLSFITSLLYFSKITDMETCYKIFRKEILKDINLKAKRFDIEPEITAKILKKGYKIKEIPISYNPRSTKKGKKIKFSDGFSVIFTLVKYRFIT